MYFYVKFQLETVITNMTYKTYKSVFLQVH